MGFRFINQILVIYIKRILNKGGWLFDQNQFNEH